MHFPDPKGFFFHVRSDSEIAAKQKICDVHCLNPLNIASGKLICTKDIFRIVISDLKQPFIFTLLRFFCTNLLRYLDIEPAILSDCHEINLCVINLSDMNRVTPAAKFKINHIFKTRRYAVRRISQNTVSHRYICKIKFLLCF